MFKALSDSVVGAGRATISDFTVGSDRIDLSVIQAVSGAARIRPVAVDKIGSRTRLSIPPRRDGATTPMAGPDEAGLAHQPGNAFAGMPLALLAQVGVDAWRAIV